MYDLLLWSQYRTVGKNLRIEFCVSGNFIHLVWSYVICESKGHQHQHQYISTQIVIEGCSRTINDKSNKYFCIYVGW